MAPSKLRAAMGAVKDRTSVGLARMAGGADEVAAEIAMAVVKATAHGESGRGRGGGVAIRGKWCLDGRRDIFGDTDGRYEVGEAVPVVWALVPRDTPATETTAEELVAEAQHLKHLLNRFTACRPTGKARTNRVVTAALHKLVKESTALYGDLTEVMAVLTERFAELDTPGCVRVHSIFTSLAKLLDELGDFYSWCKAATICRPSEIPHVEHVAQKKLDLMDEFIRDRQSRWRRSTPPSSSPHAPTVSNADMNATMPLPAPKAQDDKNASKGAPAEPAGALVVVDDHMADFFNLEEETMPLFGEEHGRNLALALFGDAPAKPAPEWETFDDPSEDWETSLVQSARKFATQSATQPPPGATGLALQPPPVVTAGEVTDPFAASLGGGARTPAANEELRGDGGSGGEREVRGVAIDADTGVPGFILAAQ
ncbi:hypothetical protein ABZP36_015080 [Zizania latifolia]